MRLVEEYLSAQAAEPVGMGDLVTLTGESGRAIEAAFQARRGTTPGLPPRGTPRTGPPSLGEREVCELAVRGMLNKQIAAELVITERTGKHHLAAAMKKLGATSAAELGSLFGHPPGEVRAPVLGGGEAVTQVVGARGRR